MLIPSIWIKPSTASMIRKRANVMDVFPAPVRPTIPICNIGPVSFKERLLDWICTDLCSSRNCDRDVLEHQVHPLPVASGVPLKPHLSSSGPAIRGTMGSYDGWSLCVCVREREKWEESRAHILLYTQHSLQFPPLSTR